VRGTSIDNGHRQPTLFYGGTLPGSALLVIAFHWDQHLSRATSMSFQGRGLVDAKLGPSAQQSAADVAAIAQLKLPRIPPHDGLRIRSWRDRRAKRRRLQRPIPQPQRSRATQLRPQPLPGTSLRHSLRAFWHSGAGDKRRPVVAFVPFLTTPHGRVSVRASRRGGSMATAKIEAAMPTDASSAAVLASAKRAEYAKYSPVFWRVAENARQIHEPFLANCIADRELFTSLAARSGDRLAGIAITAHKVSPPPFSIDPERSWLTDDFFVSTPDQWMTAGYDLLHETERQAKDGGAERLIVLTARRDEPKRQMLEGTGYTRGASWWVHPVTPRRGTPPELRTIEAVLGQAPPVYDPGGPTALALSLTDPSEVSLFDDWVSGSGAVLGIVPARSSSPEIEDALRTTGYEPASDWHLKILA
jgi:hypothetical protein